MAVVGRRYLLCSGGGLLLFFLLCSFFFFFNDTATTEIYTLSLHDALPISGKRIMGNTVAVAIKFRRRHCEVTRTHPQTIGMQNHMNGGRAVGMIARPEDQMKFRVIGRFVLAEACVAVQAPNAAIDARLGFVGWRQTRHVIGQGRQIGRAHV